MYVLPGEENNTKKGEDEILVKLLSSGKIVPQ